MRPSCVRSCLLGLNLTEDNSATLDARTEGWIAGLQLAALSIQGREHISGFIQAFTGDNRHILDYHVGEVLQRQPVPIRSFFIIPLDDKRFWYRYHHLFKEVLRLHLRAEQPNQVPVLHQRASKWYEQIVLVPTSSQSLVLDTDLD